MRRFFCFSAVILLATLLMACLGGGGGDPVSETGDLKIRLIDEDGTPYKGDALVTLGTKDEQVGGSEAYSFAKLKTGNLKITVKAVGYQESTENVTIKPGEVTEKDLRLVKEAAPPGKGSLKVFLFEEGTSGQYVPVPVTMSLEQNGQVVRTETFSTHSFEFTALTAGNYFLKASAEGFLDYSHEPELEVKANEQTSCFVELKRDPNLPRPGSLFGRIYEGELPSEEEEDEEEEIGVLAAVISGFVYEPVEVTLERDGAMVKSEVFENGRYDFSNLAPGAYLLKASAEIYQDYQAEVVIAAGEDAEHHIKLEREWSLPGRLKVDVLEFGTGGDYVTEPVTVILEQNGEVRAERVLSSGQYTFTELVAGNYLVRITSANYRGVVVNERVDPGEETPCLVLLERTGPGEDPEVIHFADSALEDCVRREIGKHTGDLTKADVKNIISLSGSVASNKLADLSGIEHLVNLQDLELRHKKLENLGPLASLSQLKTLDLGYNQISDLAPLQGLTNLEYLCLEENEIEDISFLAGLTDLQSLILYYNQISAVDALTNLTKLKLLRLDHNRILDIAPLAGLTNLVELWLESNRESTDNKLSELDALSGLTNLKVLYLSNNQFLDLRPLSGLTNLVELELRWNQDPAYTELNLEPLSTLINLEHLNLEHNDVRNLAPLSELTKLSFLRVSSNKVSDLAPLSELLNLEFLDLSSNLITELGPLSGLTRLEELNLTRNRITSLVPLVANIGFGQGTRISLGYNDDLDLSPGSPNRQALESLQDRGATVDIVL